MAADSSPELSATPPPLPESPTPGPPPGIGKAVLLCGVFYGVSIVAALLDHTLKWMGIRADMAVALFFELLFAWSVTLWIAMRLVNRSWKTLYGTGTFRKIYVVPLFLAGVGLSIVLAEAGTFIPMPNFAKEFFLTLFAGNRLFVFLGICLLAPVMEELFFRGFVFRGLLQRYSPRKAMLVSALLFAVFHLNPWQAVVAFPIGVLNAWLLLRTGGLVAGMVVHCTVNFNSSFLLPALGGLFGFSAQELIDLNHMPWQIMLIGVACASVGLLWIMKVKPEPTAHP
jgi:membrane protease YdiL (CAAX protease family)